MTPYDFKNWREAMAYTQSQAADALGLEMQTIENFEKVNPRNDKRAEIIPLSVSLACAALYHRIGPWHGSSANKTIGKEKKKAQAKRTADALKSITFRNDGHAG